jgi:MoaA/NifB/PqqE/SkfB family radical SAM enzyme
MNEVAGFHIEPTNICTLKCSGCARTRFIEEWPKHWRNHSLDIDELLKFIDIDLTGRQISLCGTYGDPIYHPEFHDFVRGLKSRGAHLTIVTNGSYKTREWWDEVNTILDTNDTVNFSVDGTPENFTTYRVNGNWPTIEQAIKSCVAGPAQTVWKYIPFAYNQADIDTVHELSQQLGIDRFFVEHSDRYDERTAHLKPADPLVGRRYQVQTTWKTDRTVSGVTPKCDNKKEHYISADGYYAPCCYLVDYRFYYKTDFGKNKKQYKITDQTFTQILNEPKMITFYQNLEQEPACQYNCPSIDK